MTTPDALDKLDKAILRCLQKNGRETYDVIGASQVGLSPSAVLRRVKRLEESGCDRPLRGARASPKPWDWGSLLT
jgi:Lrp/AsnC family leucine-responsive transcriptional regulator